MTDEQLALRAQAGDAAAADALVLRLRVLAVSQANGIYAPGMDREDIEAEALLGLVKGVRDYRPSGGVPLAAFVAICARRQVITALKTATRGKHGPLNDSVRYAVAEGGEEDAIVDLLPASGTDPAGLLERRADVRELGRKLRVELSRMEARCLILFANGYTYRQIADFDGLASAKTVDLAITRARWKLRGEGPPSWRDRYTAPPKRTVYSCPGCRRETVKRAEGRGRPPFCVVCDLRRRPPRVAAADPEHVALGEAA